MTVDVGVLAGRAVRLEPLCEAHIEGLAAAAAEDRSTYGYTVVPDGLEGTAEYVRVLLSLRARGDTIPFAQIRAADGRPVGTTRFLTLRSRKEGEHPYAVEIGGTWLAASAQGAGINAEAKLLLLTHAFDVWHVRRVDIKTDVRNDRARAGILSIGATFEGVLRNWQPSQVAGEEDKLRDSAMYSIVASEWPDVRAALRRRVDTKDLHR